MTLVFRRLNGRAVDRPQGPRSDMRAMMSLEQASTQKPVIVTGRSQGIGAGNRSEASKTPSLRERRCATLRRSRSGPNVFGGSARTLRFRRGRLVGALQNTTCDTKVTSFRSWRSRRSRPNVSRLLPEMLLALAALTEMASRRWSPDSFSLRRC